LNSKATQDTSSGFHDYYEALQLSPNADAETISRVYRILAKRYHPDNTESGNAEKFATIADAYKVLSDPEKRLAYDVRYEADRASMMKIFDDASSSDSFATDERLFDGILSLLYMSRRRDVLRGGLGIVHIERSLGCPREHLEFHTWYLRQKGWIERMEESGKLTITAAGIDHVIERDILILKRNRLLNAKNGASDESSNIDAESRHLPPELHLTSQSE
jgi:curved DNA-binding protein CbpA